MKKLPVKTHYDPSWDRWFLIWTAGDKAGTRATMDQLGVLAGGFFDITECDGDNENVFTVHPVTGERCDYVDYTLRFHSREGAEFYVYQIEQRNAAVLRVYKRLNEMRITLFGDTADAE